jgi:hypothetical protein
MNCGGKGAILNGVNERKWLYGKGCKAHTEHHSWMTTWEAIASSFCLLSSSISRFSLAFLCLSFHSFAHPSGISSQKECPVTGTSAAKADSEGVELWKLKEDAVLADATVGREGSTAGG